MNELEETLQKILLKSIELAEKTGEFVIEQGTELLQQFYLWHMTSDILGIILAFFIVLMTYILIRIVGEKNEFTDGYDVKSAIHFGYHFSMDGFVIVCIISACSLLSAIVIFCYNLYDLMFILVAPKLYLLEYFL